MQHHMLTGAALMVMTEPSIVPLMRVFTPMSKQRLLELSLGVLSMAQGVFGLLTTLLRTLFSLTPPQRHRIHQTTRRLTVITQVWSAVMFSLPSLSLAQSLKTSTQ